MATTADLEWVKRPWGEYMVVYSDAETTVKILMLKPRSAISLQLHEHREEFWTLRQGQARFVVNGLSLTAQPGMRYHVPRHVIHRIVNDSGEWAEVVEVIKGRYDEDDIIRIHDKYGRT